MSDKKVELNKKNQAFVFAALAVLVVMIIGIIAVLALESRGGGTETGITENSSVPGAYRQTTNSVEVSGDGVISNSANTTSSRSGSGSGSGSGVANSRSTSEPRASTYATISPEQAETVFGEATGKNHCTDDPDNKYIAAVVAKYDVEPALLVCVYPENFDGTESDNNIVLEFDGTKAADGSYVRSPDTLKRIYKIAADGSIIVNEDNNTPESYILFSLVKDLVMPQHPNVFDGV